MKSAFLRWAALPLSPLGRINAVKMNILPKFLYLFQAIPLFLPKSFFKNIDKLISSFIWASKTPRVSKILLQKNRLSGGLSLPNFMYYYWVANIQKLVFWVQDSSLPWCNLDSRFKIQETLLSYQLTFPCYGTKLGLRSRFKSKISSTKEVIHNNITPVISK